MRDDRVRCGAVYPAGINVMTLAEQYIWDYHADMARQGGAMAFSAVAEAWLNFSYLGVVLLGIFWGAIARFFDSRPRGIAFYILLLMIVRLFRSDFATLYKNWGLVWGGLFFVVLTSLVVYTMFTEPRSHSSVSFTGRPSLRGGMR